MIHPNASQYIEKQLLEGERILWSGQPETSVWFTKADIFLVPFSIAWSAGAIFAFTEFLAQDIESPLPFLMPFGIFFFVALYLLIGRFVIKSFLKKNTYYVVTNKRILSIFLRNKNMRESYIDTLPAIQKNIRSFDGIGTITFGHRDLVSSMYANTGLDILLTFHFSSATNIPVFYDIKEAERVYEMVRSMRDKKGKE